MSLDVALVSCRELPEPDPDAAPLSAALDAAGISNRVLAWDDDTVDWSEPRLSILRSCWNYPQHPDAFWRWAEKTAGLTRLLNPLPVVRWNLHKKYLLDLEEAGIPVAPTELVQRGAATTLAEVMAEKKWDTVVVKPAISAASFRTILVGEGGEDLDAGENHLRQLTAERDALVQAYLPAVEGYGERALIWVDGRVTHAIRKTPRFHGQHEAVSGDAIPSSAAEVRLAEQVLKKLGKRDGLGLDKANLLYARIDMAPGPSDTPVVMELELIEPSLFFNQGPEALARFVNAVARRL